MIAISNLTQFEATSVEIDGSSGVITSPLYPLAFMQMGQSFSHRITVKYGFYISIEITEFLSKSGHSISVRLFKKLIFLSVEN